MMNRLQHGMLLLLLVVMNNASAQENQVDQNNLKHGLWKGIYEESKRPRYQGTFEHGKETGLFTYYDDTKEGTVVATREFNPKDNSAYTIIYNQKKNKVSEGKAVNKLPEGEWKYYHQNSNAVMTREFYKNGKLEGVQTVYFADGNIAEETTYQKGIKHGPYKKYTPKGIVLEESTYKNGELDGKAIFRWSDGKIVSEGNFVNGLKKGIWNFYEGGKLIRTEKHPLVKKFQKATPK